MAKYDNPKFDDCRRWIQKKSEKGIAWSEIRLACKPSVSALVTFLRDRSIDDDWPQMTVDEWTELVDECEEYASKQQDFRFRGSDGALFDTTQDNGLQIPQNERSCWQLYKNSLGWKPESLTDLENATHGILRRLSTNTQATGPIKGLVIGHVQSGKTANMEALMAMAADHGWNMFIVLSGSIENLRVQTLRRMQNDLNQEGNLIWRGVEHPSKKSQHGDRARDFNFKPNSPMRYFTVCLKNAGRLKKLIDWIHADKASHDMMKILVIDDEADQASISNTATEWTQEVKERKGINKLIVNLVEDRHHKDDQTKGSSLAMNYVMYTATPYANFLNETREDSLYPRNFIWTLKTSTEYIGPNQIFGIPDPDRSDGLDIKRLVSDEDLEMISEIYDYTSSDLPISMQDSICWFLCATAAMRYWGYKKPISMLVHTSQKQDYHEAIASAISKWINQKRNTNLMELCKKVYKREVKRLPKKSWIMQIPGYSIPEDQIRDYPSFEKIKPGLEILLGEAIQHIKMNEEGDLQYHAGLHLVIDNCSKNGIQNGSDHVRLAYPDPDLIPYPSPAPAFIIVGGSTLSRGLTIEGLVSTFFLRASCQADTLMQMGRWFGYRKGYELLPRIWMTADTIAKFRFLSQLEVELRDDLKKYMVSDVTPIDYAPRILCSPKVSWLKLTSKNHQKNAIPAEMDFSGAKPQTVVFDKSQEIQEKNIRIVEDFLSRLPGTPVLSYDRSAVCWKNVSLSTITDHLLIDKFQFSARSRVFNEIDTFCEWIKQVMKSHDLDKWSVIVAGKDEVLQENESDIKHWKVANWQVGKVNRSKRDNGDDTSVDIGALRALKDCVADIDPDIVNTYKEHYGPIAKQAHVDQIRKTAGMSNIPLLIIYRIDKDSTAMADSSERVDLKMPCDIMGIHICIPGEQVNVNFRKKLTVRLPEKDKEDEVEG